MFGGRRAQNGQFRAQLALTVRGMEWTTAKRRFAFLASAYEGTGGFVPQVTWTNQPVVDEAGTVTGYIPTATLHGPTELVRYPRESDNKFAARNAVAVYENHLESAVARFIGFLGRRLPQRDGADSPLVAQMVADADMRGASLDLFLLDFAAQCKARGSMLLVIDQPEGEPAQSQAAQLAQRRVPYIRSAAPEAVKAFRTDPYSGLFVSITLEAVEWWDDKRIAVERDYTATTWRVRKAGSQIVLAEGTHAFGACPVLAFTEDGREFPRIGRFAQIADLSRRLFNARSERDEILRSQTFSLLTLQVPAEQSAMFDANTIGATIGTHSMLVHSGDQPAFIAPDSGPAATYAANIEELQASIKRISMESSVESSAQAESGEARRLRFEELNADLATFARQMQRIELRMWQLFRNATGAGADVSVIWPDDFNLADVIAELDVLASMQATGFPPRALAEKRLSIAAVEFDGADDTTQAAVKAAINEQALSEQAPPEPIV